MAYDHDEQEQLASLKAWWNQYGNLVTGLLIVALIAYAGWSGWNYYQRNQAIQASQLYHGLQRSMEAKDLAKLQRAAADMQTKFEGTVYAQMTALAVAKAAFDAGDLTTAKTQLRWAIDNARDEEYKSIAKLRLAGILLDEKAFDEGLKLLSTDFPASFAGVVADRKGDILIAQEKVSEARAAYQLALEKTDQNSPGRQLIQLKLDAIGGAAPKAAA
jgi:predicted negative regulator of RcsB-dependent stress response